jgi:hypothetical protein
MSKVKSKDTIKLDELGDNFKKPIFSGHVVSKQINRLQGKILTIVDASYSDLVQRKAVKDLVKNEFIHELCRVEELVSGGRVLEVTEEELTAAEEVEI